MGTDEFCMGMSMTIMLIYSEGNRPSSLLRSANIFLGACLAREAVAVKHVIRPGRPGRRNPSPYVQSAKGC